MAATIHAVNSKRDLSEFIDLPWRLYAGNPNWVPPLKRLVAEELSARHNPFFQHADVQLFLAREGDQVVGRISVQIDHEHNKYHRERTGFFGFFESANDPSIAGALLQAAEAWLRERGMDRMRGPFNFSINGECGLLVQGFDSPPVIMMPYTHPYYLDLLQRFGYAKRQDLFAWLYNGEKVPERAQRIVDELRLRPEVRVRTPNMRRFNEEVTTILDVFNDAWSDNWGFVPATPAEARKMAKDLKIVADPELVPIIEVDGKVAAVALGIPNLNEAIHDLNGKLLPFGIIKLLWRLKVRGLKSGRLILLGVRNEFRNRRYAGLAYLLCDEIYHRARARGYKWSEFSWTLEENRLINAMIRNVSCHHYKTYRIYEKVLTP